MEELIMFLLLTPVIGVVLIIIGIMIALCSNHEDKAAGQIQVYPDVPPVMPEQKSSIDYPDLADQLDGRLTNVFRNPWKGIL